MCPDWENTSHFNKALGWALFKNTIDTIGTDYFSPLIKCITCGRKFSLQQGVSEAFASDIVIDDFRFNSSERGIIMVTVGNLVKIDFSQPFVDIPDINLTAYLQPVDAVSGYVTPEGFAIFTSANNCALAESRQIGWHASGNRASSPIPLWRILLSSAKYHQKNKCYRAEILEMESAFEIFFSEYIANALKGKFREETIDWLLKKQRIEGQMSIGYREITGQNIHTQYPTEYTKWQRYVKEVRDQIIHQGITVTPEQSTDARKALFNFLTRIDSSTIDHFQIQMDDIGIDGPHFTFGRFKAKQPSTESNS